MNFARLPQQASLCDFHNIDIGFQLQANNYYFGNIFGSPEEPLHASSPEAGLTQCGTRQSTGNPQQITAVGSRLDTGQLEHFTDAVGG